MSWSQLINKWLKTKMRSWLNEDLVDLPEPPTPRVLDVVLGGVIQRVAVQHVVGLRLACRASLSSTTQKGYNTFQVYLVGSEQCCDPKLFWKIFKELSGATKIEYEDGGEVG